MTPLESLLKIIVLKKVEGSVYLVPAICDFQIEEVLTKEKNALKKVELHIKNDEILENINKIMWESHAIKDKQFGRQEGFKIMKELEEWASNK